MKTIAILLALLSLCACAVDDGYPEAALGVASDDETGPVVASCKTVVGNSVWAVAMFPDETVERLASVRAVGHSAIGEPHGAPPGFAHVQLPVFVRDGEAAVNCDAGPVTLPAYDYVIFSLP